jgi:hypothetical protein
LRIAKFSGRILRRANSDPGFTLKLYAHDGRDAAAFVSDVLSRAVGAKVGS